MTGASTLTTDPTHAPSGELRCSLKPANATPGHVDGAWWPRTPDLVAEIPALLDRLADGWGAVDRVSYDLSAWSPAARRITVRGRRVRLDGFRGRRPADAIHLSGPAGNAILTLLVIPPDTDPEVAERALRRAGTGDNQDSTTDLLSRDPSTAPRSTS